MADEKKIDDGGPAFPGFGEVFTTDAAGRTLPQSAWGLHGAVGLSRRDYFAGKALAAFAGALARGSFDIPDEEPFSVKSTAAHAARLAYAYADAMIAEGNKP